MLKNREIEYKYRTCLSLTKFKERINKFDDFLNYSLEIFGNDIFYEHSDRKDTFVRLRTSENESTLTAKKKINLEQNNIDRYEVNYNINVDSSEKEKDLLHLINIPNNRDQFETFLIDHIKVNGFKEQFTLFKYIIIYQFKDVCLSWYKVFDKDLKSLDTFIEIEANEGYYSRSEAIMLLDHWEEKLATAGIININMFMNDSLYEIYKKRLTR